MRSTHTTRVMWCFLAVMGLAAGCGDGGSAGSTSSGGLLLSLASVSMVPGGSEQVRALEEDGNAVAGDVVASSSDPAVATAAANGSTVMVSGVAVGRCSITFRSSDGRSGSLEVQVYDPLSMDAGELSIAFTSDFTLQFVGPLGMNDWVVGSWSAWQPVAPDGYYPVGSLAMGWPGPDPLRTTPYGDPNGERAVMVVKGNVGSAIAPTSEYEMVDTTADLDRQVTGVIWRPLCLGGYRPLGVVMTWESPLPANPTPPGYPTACVREDLTTAGRVDHDTLVWADATRRDIRDLDAAWQVDQPVIGSHPRAYLAPGTFVWSRGWADNVDLLPPPSADPAVNILDVELQLLGEAPPQAVFPRLSDDPAPETAPVFTKAVLVPCSAVKDPAHDATWQITHSPFYRLERSVFWRLIAHDYNATSVEQPNSVQFTAGITTEESQRIWEATNVSVSTEVGLEIGVDAGPLSAKASEKVTVTLNDEMGYETAHSLAELRSRTDTLALQTPPRTSVALWQQISRFTLYRHNGSRLEVADFWEAGTSTFYADERPMD